MVTLPWLCRQSLVYRIGLHYVKSSLGLHNVASLTRIVMSGARNQRGRP
jgi:hypothetical protein